MVISLQTNVSDATNGTSLESSFLCLDIYDTATHALLWTLDEPVNYFFKKKDLDGGVTALMDDLKTLAAGNIPGSPDVTKPEPTKTRLSDEGKK